MMGLAFMFACAAALAAEESPMLAILCALAGIACAYWTARD